VGALLWLVAGVALIAVGLGFVGFGPVRDQWPVLALAGGAVGLLAAALYFHPLYLAAVAIDLVLVVLVWGRATAPS
jgi:hypothetical protein